MTTRIGADEKKIYERFRYLHAHKGIIGFLSQHLPSPEKVNRVYDEHGIEIATKENESFEGDKKKFPATHPIRRYDLIFGYRGNGFCMRQYWHGDLCPHLSHLAFEFEDNVPVYSGEERGGRWKLLEAFPDLTVKKMNDEIESALKRINIKLEEDALTYKRRIERKTEEIESLASFLEEFRN